MEVRDDLKMIFFVTFTDKPPRSYFDLAINLREEGLTLVPIKFDQLLSFYQGKKRIHVICVVSSVFERKAYLRSIRIMKQALLTSKITLYHFSSFTHLDLRKELSRLKNYHFVTLPVPLHSLARAMRKFYEYAMYDGQKWPGGKRAKLPFDEVTREE